MTTQSGNVELAAVIVHQLRNRLSRVLFTADALLTAYPQTELGATAARLKRGVDELTGWFDQLIELAQLLSGGASLHLTSLDLAEVVRAVVEQAQPQLAARKHSIVLEGLDEPVRILADRRALEQILSNLVSNAAKFTPAHGHVTVRVDAGADDVILHVVDDGIGIAHERLPTLFDAPTQAGGRGEIHVGLFLVQRLAALHGGDVRVVSGGERRGTEVIVTLPRSATSDRTLPVPRALVVSERHNPALATVMRSFGYDVDVAPSGPIALELARDASWDVVLVASSIAARERGLPQRLRAAAGGAALLLVGDGPLTPEVVVGYDAALAAGYDADLLQAALCAG